eukprot:5071430-Pleurochrysis_carterae.AAC.2
MLKALVHAYVCVCEHLAPAVAQLSSVYMHACVGEKQRTCVHEIVSFGGGAFCIDFCNVNLYDSTVKGCVASGVTITVRSWKTPGWREVLPCYRRCTFSPFHAASTDDA